MFINDSVICKNRKECQIDCIHSRPHCPEDCVDPHCNCNRKKTYCSVIDRKTICIDDRS